MVNNQLIFILSLDDFLEIVPKTLLFVHGRFRHMNRLLMISIFLKWELQTRSRECKLWSFRLNASSHFLIINGSLGTLKYVKSTWQIAHFDRELHVGTQHFRFIFVFFVYFSLTLLRWPLNSTTCCVVLPGIVLRKDTMRTEDHDWYGAANISFSPFVFYQGPSPFFDITIPRNRRFWGIIFCFEVYIVFLYRSRLFLCEWLKILRGIRNINRSDIFTGQWPIS